MQEKKQLAPLIEESKKPATQTQLKSERIPPLEKIATDTEDSSILDLSIQKTTVVIYIRPLNEDLGELLEIGDNRLSYIFRGIIATHLKEQFQIVLGKLKAKDYTTLREGVFQYKYHIDQRTRVYDSAETLNKEHNKN